MKNKSIIIHSVKMFCINIKSYSLLSVSIILSFAILLGFMVFSDSVVYNNYKSLLASPINAVLVETQDESKSINGFISSCKRIDSGLTSYTYLVCSALFPQYGERIQAKTYFVPSGGNPIIVHEFVGNGTGETDYIADYVHELEIVKGTNRLSENDAILCESLYECLLQKRELPLQVIMTMQLLDGSIYPLVLNVVGICKDSSYDSFMTDAAGNPVISGSVFCKQDLIIRDKSELLILPTYVAAIATDKPAEIVAFADKQGLLVRSVYTARNDAIDIIRSNINTKMWITIILYLILGINLFGCFENALSKRDFEISVRRALGASGWQIIIQFLIEGLIVMMMSILASIALITVLSILLKLYIFYFKNVVWTIFITNNSAWNFIICGFSMTTLFSVIFAFRTTNVEIVKNIKAE